MWLRTPGTKGRGQAGSQDGTAAGAPRQDSLPPPCCGTITPGRPRGLVCPPRAGTAATALFKAQATGQYRELVWTGIVTVSTSFT